MAGDRFDHSQHYLFFAMISFTSFSRTFIAMAVRKTLKNIPLTKALSVRVKNAETIRSARTLPLLRILGRYIKMPRKTTQ